MNNPIELPEMLIGLPGKWSFSELDEAGKALVLRYLTHSEYDELHEAACAALLVAQRSARREGVRSELLSAFDDHHNRRSEHSSKFAWSAAAVLAVVVCVLAFRAFVSGIDETPKMVTVTDTIYVDRPGPVKVIRDTVTRMLVKKAQVETVVAGRPQVTMNLADTDGIQVLSVSEFASEANSMKGNSLSDDSLSWNFEFVPF